MNAVYNPKHRPERDLPVIMGFVNGSFGMGDVIGQLIAEDGQALGSHISSSAMYLQYDLGIEAGSRSDRHELFQKTFPGGYRMEFVQPDDPRLAKAVAANRKLAASKKNPGAHQEGRVEVTVSHAR